jgi:hypothetical protein
MSQPLRWLRPHTKHIQRRLQAQRNRSQDGDAYVGSSDPLGLGQGGPGGEVGACKDVISSCFVKTTFEASGRIPKCMMFK